MKTALSKRTVISGLASILVASAIAQSNPHFVVRIDDMGSSHAANMACMETLRNGIATSVEVMVVAPWFPEAVKMLNENPGIDVGLHLTFTSEWDNMKWHPLTSCKSLTDKNGYFLPMMNSNPNYPGLAIKEHSWNLQEVEQEARAQIELALRNLPQISHISGHMGATGFSPEVTALMLRLAEEYNLPIVSNKDTRLEANLHTASYEGPSRTFEEKEESFARMIQGMETDKNYVFVDHPALDCSEMKGIGHIGYDWVAQDRQGVTDLLTSPRIKRLLDERQVKLLNYNQLMKSLPRAKASRALDKAFNCFLEAVKNTNTDVHSVMVLQHGNVLKEHWMGTGHPDSLHILYSVSKTFTATAIGFAVNEGRLKLTDKVISFFPDLLPDTLDENMKKLEIRHLLTMSSGHDTDPTSYIRHERKGNWTQDFLASKLPHEPGSFFLYNNMCTYMLSAIIQQVTGEKVINYLYPRLFRPLGIIGATWTENPQGVNVGSSGLRLKTEDLAKMGQLLLQRGKWNGKTILPETWVMEASSKQIASRPAELRPEEVTMKPKDSDWLQGYGYNMWLCRHNAFRADGAKGQFIIVLPEQDAVIVLTSNVKDMQAEINLVWKYLFPALKN